jgi:SRSO17 transposase
MFDDPQVGERFESYLDGLTEHLGHVKRIDPFRLYCLGLLVTPGRKSVEPMAACVRPGSTAATHQSLLHCVGQSQWSDEAVLEAVRDYVLPVLRERSPTQALIIDDTGLPKKGRHSVGVSRQYCGQNGKQDNCQVAVSLSVCTEQASLPITYRLYLPQAWTQDELLRRKAGIATDIVFETKPQIAARQLSAAVEKGITAPIVLMDAAYGNNGDLRDHVTNLGLAYGVGILSTTCVWLADDPPQFEVGRSGRAQGKRWIKAGQHPPSVKELAKKLKPQNWQTISWREGTNAPLSGRFAAVRVHSAHRYQKQNQLLRAEWLVIEWPPDEDQPTKYWLSTLPPQSSLAELVHALKMRWYIERDYQELKQEIGLGHFEGRGWTGFHHHATLCIAAYGFLIAERARIPPSGHKRQKLSFQKPAFPEGYQSRGTADKDTAPRAKLHQHSGYPYLSRYRPKSVTMPMLPTQKKYQIHRASSFVTQ